MFTFIIGFVVYMIFIAILFKFSFGYSTKGKVTIAVITLTSSLIGFSIYNLFSPWHSILLIILLLLLSTIFLQKRAFMYQK